MRNNYSTGDKMQDNQTTGFGNYFPAVLQDWNPSEKKKKLNISR